VKKIDLAGLLVFLSISSYLTGAQENIAISSIPIWLLAIALSFFAYSNAKNPANASLNSGKVLFAVSILLIFLTISSLFSTSPLTERILGSSQRGDGLTNYVALILIFVGMIQLDLKSKVRLIDWVILAGIFQALVGFAQILGLEVFNKISYEGVTGTLRNTNTAGFFLALLATISLSRALDHSAGMKFRGIYFVLYGTFALQAVLTKTIQGPVLTVAGTLGLVSVFIYARLKESKLKTGTRIFPWAILLASMLTIFLVYPQLLKIETFKIRTLYWHAAWEMFLGNPILGVGPGAFGSFVSEYRSEDYVKTLGPNLRVDDAHNVFLHLLSTLGFVPTLIIFISILVISISALKRSRDNVQNTSPVIVLIFFLGSAISYFNPILILVFLIFLAGLHSPKESMNRNKSLRIQIATATTIFVTLIGFALVVISQTNVPDRLTQSEAKGLLVDASFRCESRTQLLTKVIGGGIQLSEQEIEAVYLSDVRCLEIGIAIARRDTLENRSTAPSAINRVLELDPNNPVIIGLEALVADKSNDSVSAKKLIEKANSIRDLATLGDPELSKQFLELLAKGL
jgi:O-antigen ligase